MLFVLLLLTIIFLEHGSCFTTTEIYHSPNLLEIRNRGTFQFRGRNTIFSTSKALSINDHNSIVFAGVRFRHPIAKSLRDLNLTDPSPIQKSSLLPLVTGLSCILHAETGSGKTLCYLLPILKRLHDSELHSSGIRVLIIVPTKELAVQVRKFMNFIVKFYYKTYCNTFRWHRMFAI